MARMLVRSVLVLLLFTLSASGQNPKVYPLPVQPVSIEVQVYLPGGQKPKRPVVLHVLSVDGRINEVQYTTSTGYAFLGQIERGTPLTITVLSEAGFYRSSRLSLAAQDGRTEIYLKPEEPLAPVVSVGALHEPEPGARKLYEKAMRDVKEGKLEPAAAKLEQAAALDTRYAAPLIGLGFLRLEQERPQDAEGLFERALELDRTSPQALAGVGIARTRRGEYQAALEPLEKAAAQLGSPYVLAHLGVALLETGRAEDAEAILRQVAAKPSPYRDFSTLLLGRIYVEAGDRQRGLAMFESVAGSAGPEADMARQAIRLLQEERGKPN